MKTSLIILVGFFLGTLTLGAQGFQSSQIDLHQHLQQAASPALPESNAKLWLAYRSAWNGQTPFRNMLLSYQHKVKAFSIGAKIRQNDAGAISLKSSKILLDISYKKLLNEQGDFLALGVSGGVLQQRFKEQSFQFDNQYTEGSGFDAGVASGEAFITDNQLVPLINVGLIAKKKFNRLATTFGLSLNQINKPSIGFYQNKSASLPLETSVFTQVELPWSDRFQGTVYLAFLKSSLQDEQMVGLEIDYKCADKYWLKLGAVSKINEAFILSAGLQFYKSTLMFSYDFNLARLSEIEGFNGVFELTASHDF